MRSGSSSSRWRGHERANAVLEGLLGAAGDEQHPQPRDRLGREQLGERDLRGDAGEVVVGARDRRAAPHVGQQRRADRADRETRARGGAAAADRAGERRQRPGETEPPLRRRCLEVLDQPRRALVEAALQRLVEQTSSLRRVVVGEHDERRRRLVLAGARDHVDRRAPPAHQAPQDARPVVSLVEDARERRRRKQRPARAPAAQRERGGEHPRHAEPGQRRLKDPPRGLVLKRDPHAVDPPQPPREPLGGLALAGRARRALDRGERLNDLAQRGLDGVMRG